LENEKKPRFGKGQWVRVEPGQGFVGESDRLRAEIVDDPEELIEQFGFLWCMNHPGCGCASEGFEHPNLMTEPDPQNGGKRHLLCHVCENKMTPCDPPESNLDT